MPASMDCSRPDGSAKLAARPMSAASSLMSMRRRLRRSPKRRSTGSVSSRADDQPITSRPATAQIQADRRGAGGVGRRERQCPNCRANPSSPPSSATCGRRWTALTRCLDDGHLSLDTTRPSAPCGASPSAAQTISLLDPMPAGGAPRQSTR